MSGDNSPCLRDRFRSAIIIKNRFGTSDVVVPLNFFGEIGYFKELPSSKSITDLSPFLILEDKIEEDLKEIDNNNFTYTF